MYNVEEIKNLGLKDIHLGAEPTNLSLYLWYGLLSAAAIALAVFILLRTVPVLKDMIRLTRAFYRSDSFASDLNLILKDAGLRYFPRDRIASLAGRNWTEFLDRTGLCSFTKSFDDWDGMLYGNRILTRQERRRLYRHGMLWLCSNLWRLA
ncbi:MAG: DUF4381 domain-containing protein [Succinivibrionaceae bacterium]|nr:DUF4381 domain-containing protein [Succinivibrionaceae bacterium]